MDLDNLDMSNVDLSRIPEEYKEELLELLGMRDEYLKYHKLERFQPYEFQKKFYAASKMYKRRFLCAANR